MEGGNGHERESRRGCIGAKNRMSRGVRLTGGYIIYETIDSLLYRILAKTTSGRQTQRKEAKCQLGL